MIVDFARVMVENGVLLPPFILNFSTYLIKFTLPGSSHNFPRILYLFSIFLGFILPFCCPFLLALFLTLSLSDFLEFTLSSVLSCSPLKQ